MLPSLLASLAESFHRAAFDIYLTALLHPSHIVLLVLGLLLVAATVSCSLDTELAMIAILPSTPQAEQVSP
jgi:hypothetical protein